MKQLIYALKSAGGVLLFLCAVLAVMFAAIAIFLVCIKLLGGIGFLVGFILLLVLGVFIVALFHDPKDDYYD